MGWILNGIDKKWFVQNKIKHVTNPKISFFRGNG
jgi:hypothetical protein